MANVFSSKRSCGETELTMSSLLENKSLKIHVSSENTFEFCDFACQISDDEAQRFHLVYQTQLERG
jgi:hypothetical protein